MKELSIDEKLEMVREFLQEKGAKLNLTIYRADSKQKAEELIKRYADKLGLNYHFSQTGQWADLDSFNLTGIDMTIYYKLSKEDKKAQLRKQLQMLEEDVDLSGMPDEVNESA